LELDTTTQNLIAVPFRTGNTSPPVGSRHHAGVFLVVRMADTPSAVVLLFVIAESTLHRLSIASHGGTQASLT
jgi:hypothetical protein